MEIPRSLLEHIITEARTIKYGTITIVLNETSNQIDVVTENRKRFEKEKLHKY